MKTINWVAGCEIPECEFHDVDERHIENLTQNDFAECVYDYLSDLKEKELREKIAENEVIEVTGYDRSKVSRSKCEFLDCILENLDEEYGDQVGCDHKVLSASEIGELRALEQAFIDELLKRYNPWTCDQVVAIVVPVADWFAANPAARKGLGL